MQRKPRITGFARFIMVMVFVVPLAYIGASYYNGEDGIANIKNLLGIDKKENVENVETVEMENERFTPTRDETPSLEDKDVESMREELDYQQKRLEELKKENERLRKSVFEKEQELSKIKNQ